MTVCNVPASIAEEIVASFLSAYGCVEDITQLQAATKSAHGDYEFRVCLDSEGFQAIPDTIYYKDRQMMVVVEGRQQHCWNCKQIGHLAKVCLHKAPKEMDTSQQPKLTEGDVTKVAPETENPPSKENRWTQVTQRRRKSDIPPKKLRTHWEIPNQVDWCPKKVLQYLHWWTKIKPQHLLHQLSKGLLHHHFHKQCKRLPYQHQTILSPLDLKRLRWAKKFPWT